MISAATKDSKPAQLMHLLRGIGTAIIRTGLLAESRVLDRTHRFAVTVWWSKMDSNSRIWTQPRAQGHLPK
jgi:hypothetical protein